MSSQVHQTHDGGVAVLQSVSVCLTQCVVFFNDAVAADLSVSEKPEQRNSGEEFVEDVGLHVVLPAVVVVSPRHAGEHEADGVGLWNVGGFQASDGDFGRRGRAHILIHEH